MTATELLQRVEALGVRVRPAAGRLRFEGATSRISPKLRLELAARKAELLTALAERGGLPATQLPQAMQEVEQQGTSGPPPAILRVAEPGAGPEYDEGAGERTARAVVLEAVRRRLPPSLRVWEDRLLPLIHWHLVMAFERGAETGWRRYLPASLAPMSDAEVAALVDWPYLAALERTLTQRGDDAVEALSRGATRLAAWWNRRRAS